MKKHLFNLKIENTREGEVNTRGRRENTREGEANTRGRRANTREESKYP